MTRPPPRARLEVARLQVLVGEGEVSRAAAAARGGADVIQVRAKDASTADRVALARSVRDAVGPAPLVIVNDDPIAARRAGADGVHVGEDDPSVEAARATVGPDRVIGRTARSVQSVCRAAAAGADHVGVGTAFPSETRPDLEAGGPERVAAACLASPLPAFAIGGIGPDNLEELLERGVRRIAVAGAVRNAADPGRTCRELRRLLDRYWTDEGPRPHPHRPEAP